MGRSVQQASPGGLAVPLAARDHLPHLLRLIGQADQRVLAAVFIIDPRPEDDREGSVKLVLDTLAMAKWRGLDVRVLAGGSNRTPAIELADRVARRYLESRGVPCRRFAGVRGETSLHSKYVIVDDTIVVGSHNWTHRALRLENELSVAVTSPELAHVLTGHFEWDWTRAAEPGPVEEGGQKP